MLLYLYSGSSVEASHTDHIVVVPVPIPVVSSQFASLWLRRSICDTGPHPASKTFSYSTWTVVAIFVQSGSSSDWQSDETGERTVVAVVAAVVGMVMVVEVVETEPFVASGTPHHSHGDDDGDVYDHQRHHPILLLPSLLLVL